MTTGNTSPFLLALLQQQEFIGMLGLGKIADPSTGEATVDLDKTRYAIGMLEMLEQKTAGNLSDSERQQIRQVLTTLRLNFVEEARRASAATGDSAQGAASEDVTPEMADEHSETPSRTQAEE
jgi:hypothetical protein